MILLYSAPDHPPALPFIIKPTRRTTYENTATTGTNAPEKNGSPGPGKPENVFCSGGVKAAGSVLHGFSDGSSTLAKKRVSQGNPAKR